MSTSDQARSSTVRESTSSAPDPSPPSAQEGVSAWDVFKGVALIPMLIWPWVFFAIAFDRPDGLALNSTAENIVQRNPVDTTWVVTNIANVSAFLVTFLFQSAVKTFLVVLVTSEPTKIFRVAFVSAAKAPSQSGALWLWANRRYLWLVRSGKWGKWILLAILLLVYIALFFLILGGFTSLLTPRPIQRSSTLSGTELDFTSDDPNCLLWFDQNTPSDDADCKWTDYNGFSFSQCLNLNQMVDILESGQTNIRSSIPNNNHTATFDQLGGLQFSTPIRGVLPNGPEGVPGFDTLSRSPLTDGAVNSAISFDYTINLQGVASNVTCAYTPDSPIIIWDLPGREWA
ncbi:hypothetical protein JAAARDRAFT_61397 [Jaapia argillacea MUCL 33604]|uniref:Uncharacterized protein n=1 Tax=Jaapia argillacea MUCL 33604 TaxID=933084 RepID=A0A067PHQ2_9AGAM|nr:hypothetical protein JAAARDRAFT_61397 [Jaapia argillacea MUCL 33604]